MEHRERRNHPVPYFFLSVKDLSFLVLRLPQPLLLEVGIREMLGNFHPSEIHLCGCGNNKFLVGPAQRHTVDSQGA